MSKMASTPKASHKLTSSTLNSHSSSHRNSITQPRSMTQSFSSQSQILRAAGPLTLLGNLRGAVVAQQAGVQALKDIAKWHSLIQVRTAGGKGPVFGQGGVRKSCNSSQMQDVKRASGKTKKGKSADYNKSQVCIGKKPDYDGNAQYRPARVPNVSAEIRVFGSQIDSLPGSATRSREETPVVVHVKRPASLNNEFLHSFEFKDNCCEPSSFSLLHTSLSSPKMQQKKLLLAAQRLNFHSKTPLD